jgi:hypothetical protein
VPAPPYPINDRIGAYNALLAGSDLPMLMRRFAGLDGDHDGDTDHRYFVDHDVPSGAPDDGVHPNDLGERVYALNLARALIAPLERQRPDYAGSERELRRRRHGRLRPAGATTALDHPSYVAPNRSAI